MHCADEHQAEGALKHSLTFEVLSLDCGSPPQLWMQGPDLGRCSAFRRRSSAATVAVSAYWPGAGSNAGGSILSVELNTSLPDSYDTLYCKFDKTVVATYASEASSTSGGPTASFIVPSSRKERQKIELAVSSDNVTFEVFGSFVYYEPLQIHSIAPAVGLVTGGTLVRIELQADPWPGGFTQAQADLVAQPSCRFDDITAVGSYHAPGSDSLPSITCKSPLVKAGPGPVNLTVSLNGQEWTYSRATFTYLNVPAGGVSQPLIIQQVAEAEALTSWEEYLLAATGGLQSFPKFGIAEIGPSNPGVYRVPSGGTSFYGPGRDSFYGSGDDDFYGLPSVPGYVAQSACMYAMHPRVGPVTGSTTVSILLTGQLPPPPLVTPFCSFGGQQVAGTYGTSEDSHTTILCAAPATDNATTLTVLFSLDGSHFISAGASFTYYAPFAANTFRNVPPAQDQQSPFQPIIPLDISIFPVEFLDYDSVALTASCRLDGLVTPAVYNPLSDVYYYPDGVQSRPSISCFTRGAEGGDFVLQVSLDGQNYVNVSTPLNATVNFNGPHVDLPALDVNATLSLRARPYYPLAPSVSLCTTFNGDAAARKAALASLAISKGDLAPAFKALVLAYSANLLSKSASGFSITVVPAAAGSRVRVGTVKLQPTWVSSGVIDNVFFPTNLSVGLHNLSVEVTAPNGLNQLVYQVALWVHTSAPVLSVSLTAGSLNPPFDVDVYDYTVALDAGVRSISLLPTPTNISSTRAYLTRPSSDPGSGRTVYAALDWYRRSGINLYSDAWPQPNSACPTYSSLHQGEGVDGMNWGSLMSGWPWWAPGSWLPVSLDCVETTVVQLVVQQDGLPTRTYTLRFRRAAAVSTAPLGLATLRSNYWMQNVVPPFDPAFLGPYQILPDLQLQLDYQLNLVATPSQPGACVRATPSEFQRGVNNVNLTVTALDKATVTYALILVARYDALAATSLTEYSPTRPPTNGSVREYSGFTETYYVRSDVDYVILSTWTWLPQSVVALDCQSGCSSYDACTKTCAALPVLNASQYAEPVMTSVDVNSQGQLSFVDWAARRAQWAVPVSSLGYTRLNLQIDCQGLCNDERFPGATSGLYSVVISRQQGSDTSLSSLGFSNGTLAPTFSAGASGFSGTVTVPKGLDVVHITAVATDPTAEVAVEIDGAPAHLLHSGHRMDLPPPFTPSMLKNGLIVPRNTWVWQATPPRANQTKKAKFAVTFNRESSPWMNFWGSTYSVDLVTARGTDSSLAELSLILQNGTVVDVLDGQFAAPGGTISGNYVVPKETLSVGLRSITSDPGASVNSTTVASVDPALASATTVTSSGLLFDGSSSDTSVNGTSIATLALPPGSTTSNVTRFYQLSQPTVATNFLFTVTAEDGVAQTVFNLSVTRELGRLSTLRALAITINGTTTSFVDQQDAALLQAPDVPAGTDSAVLSWTTEDPDATADFSAGPASAGLRSRTQHIYAYTLVLPSNAAASTIAVAAAHANSTVVLDGSTPRAANATFGIAADGAPVTISVASEDESASATYTVTPRHLQPFEMTPYLDFSANASEAVSGDTLSFSIRANCARYAAAFGGDAYNCAELSGLALELVLVAVDTGTVLETKVESAPGQGPFSFSPQVAGAFAVQARPLVCVRQPDVCTGKTYQPLNLPQNLVIRPGAISPATSRLILADGVTLDLEDESPVTVIQRDAAGNLITTPPTVVVCPTVDNSTATTNGSAPLAVDVVHPLCPATNLTVSMTQLHDGTFSVTYAAKLAGRYRVVLQDSAGSSVVEAQQIVLLPKDAPIDAGRSVLVVPGNFSRASANVSFWMVPKDQYGNQIWVGDDMSGISAQLYPQGFSTPSPWEALISFEPYQFESASPTARFKLDFSGVSQAGTYTLRVLIHGVRMSNVPAFYLPQPDLVNNNWPWLARYAASTDLVDAYYPGAFSTSGGAYLTLTLLNPSLTPNYWYTTSLYYNDWLVCRFDSTTVVQGGHITNYDPRASSGPTVTFLVPPFTGGSKEVDLELSADGILFKKFGSLMYHEPLSVDSVSPPSTPLGGGVLEVRLMNRQPLPANFTDDDIANFLDPSCLVNSSRVAGTYNRATPDYPWPSVSCVSPKGQDGGLVSVTASLNGLEWAAEPRPYLYVGSHQLTDEELLSELQHWGDQGQLGEFYDLFYGTGVDGFYATSGGGSVRYPTAPACMEGIFPSVGPLSGGTNVSILVSGQLPHGRSKPPVCAFGSLKINGSYSPETSTISCTAPAAAAIGLSQPGTVALTVSLDGRTFTPEGAAFTYYADFYPHNFRNVPPPPDQLTTPFQPTIPLDSAPFPGAFSDFDLVATSATCKLNGLVTPAIYQPLATVYYWWGYVREQPTISCVTRGSPMGDRNLQVSLDGQHYVTVTPALDQQTDLYSPGNFVTRPDPTALVERHSGRANFTRLPATSRYCIAFRTGAAAVAALAGLTI
ncbi:hypothetical protein KFL_004350010, partial [Klebsormidium nitens]